MGQAMRQKLAERAACQAEQRCPTVRAAQSWVQCDGGLAGEYPCKGVDMMSFVPLASLNSSGANDLWGWTDPVTGREYAVVGLLHGTSFVDVTEPSDPRVFGMMRTQSAPSIWRDVKVYADHAFVVSEAADHGMQVFDLARLRGRAGQGVLHGTEQPGVLRNRYGLCLVEGPGSEAGLGGNASGHLQLGACVGARPGSAEDRGWSYDRAAGSLVSRATGLCLEAAGPLVSGGLVSLQGCDPGRSGQRWTYSEASGQLLGRGGCLDAIKSWESGGRPRIRGCDSSRGGQQWRVGGGLPEAFAPDAVYKEVSSAHNVVINEQTGRAYVLGSKTCSGGLHIVDVSEPKDPKFLGCFSEDGYAHDAQCELYRGPDARFRGREVCFSYNEKAMTVVDVTDAEKPRQIARVGYDNSRYVHQGWLDERQEYLFLNDELDEASWKPDRPDGPSNRTRTLIWDVRSLTSPSLVGNYYSRETAIDHNLYVDGRLVFEANYCAGLRVMEARQERSGAPYLEEIGFFDVEPACDTPRFRGAWSNYPFYKSGVVAVTSMQRGLFLLRPQLTAGLQASRREAHERRGERRARGLALPARRERSPV